MNGYIARWNTYDRGLDMQLDESKIYSTLGERSKDDDGQALLESTQKVYDFDEIKKEEKTRFCNS